MVTRIVALQLDAVAFVDEGIERVLDTIQERAFVNTLMLDVFWFSRSVSERALAGERYRGHGFRLQERDLLGGHFGTLRTPRLPVPAGPDVLAAVAAAARKRGLRVFATVKDMVPDSLAGGDELLERDFNGQRAGTSCKRNLGYRELLNNVIQDLIRSYRVDGIMYMAERQGAFTDTLGLRFRGIARGLPGSRTCFCDVCRAKADEHGIPFTRVVAGFRELEQFVAAGRARQRPADGYYVTLWRLMFRHPELLQWEHFWYEGLHELTRSLYTEVKSENPSVLFGSHTWPNMNMSPLIRAEQAISELTPYHDFLKVAMYHNCGGPRIASYIESVSQTMWGDVPPDELLQLHYRVMGFSEHPYPEVRRSGLKRDFVARETSRVVEGARGSRTQILAGIDVDIPILRLDLGASAASEASRTTRQDVRAAVKQAFQAGAHGIVVSREYAEMQLEHLSGVGDAIRELGLNT